MRYLFVGDVHAKVSDLPECRKLIEYIEEVAFKENVDRIVFLGDQYHNHALINVEVMAFWSWAFDKLSLFTNVIALVGNHDMPGDSKSRNHALMLHQDECVQIVGQPMVTDDILFVPYMSNHEEFVNTCKSHPTKLVVCHQTFDGAKYENGFYAKDAIDPNLIVQDKIISGHLHTPASFGKVWYIGSPRWQTLSDANVQRSIWVMDIEQGKVDDATNYDTEGVCQPIYHFEYKLEPVDVKLCHYKNDKVYVDLYGDESYIKTASAQVKEFVPTARIRTFKTVSNTTQVKESDGISVAWDKFLNGFNPPNGTSKAVLAKMAQERMNVKSA